MGGRSGMLLPAADDASAGVAVVVAAPSAPSLLPDVHTVALVCCCCC